MESYKSDINKIGILNRHTYKNMQDMPYFVSFMKVVTFFLQNSLFVLHWTDSASRLMQ